MDFSLARWGDIGARPKGDIVILDNLGSHKGKPVRQAIRDDGASTRPRIQEKVLKSNPIQQEKMIPTGNQTVMRDGLKAISEKTTAHFVPRKNASESRL